MAWNDEKYHRINKKEEETLLNRIRKNKEAIMFLGLACKLEVKLKLVQDYFGDFISTPHGVCPNCKHELSSDEILAGFSTNPYDFNTTCPKCEEKFLSHLIITDKKTDKEKELTPVIFMCQAQTLQEMETIKKERKRIGIAYLGKNNRQLFYNMVRHWGSYEKAIQQI